MSAAGVNRDLEKHVAIWPLNIINEKISSVFTSIYWIPEMICPMGPLEALWGKKPVHLYYLPKGISYGFRIIKIGRIVSKIYQEQICSHNGLFIEGPYSTLF